jgi:REP element-mobilizing transposase RayT
MSKKRTEFGEILREKWNAICETVAKENEIFLEAYYMTSAFDCVYFSLSSVPKLAPSDVLNFVKIGVYNIIVEKYPHLREELLRDSWYLIDKSCSYTKMDYIAYFNRSDIKRCKDILYSQTNGKEICKIVLEGISNAIDHYNQEHEKPIDVLMYRCVHSHSVEIIIGCPITVSASEIVGKIKGGSSYYIRKNYPQFFNENDPYFVHKKAFWSKGNFFALSRRHVETISRDKSIYLRLLRKWENVINETEPIEKGKLLELFMVDMIKIMEGFEILRDENSKYDINLGFEQIDLTIKNKSKLLERMGPLFKIECKNWTEKIGNKEIRDFSGKLRGGIRLGILVSVNGFGKYDKEILERLFFNDRKMIVTVSGNEIESWLNKILEGFNQGASERSTIEIEFENKIFRTYITLT